MDDSFLFFFISYFLRLLTGMLTILHQENLLLKQNQIIFLHFVPGTAGDRNVIISGAFLGGLVAVGPPPPPLAQKNVDLKLRKSLLKTITFLKFYLSLKRILAAPLMIFNK